MSSRLEELAASLVENLEKKSQRRDGYLKLAKTVKEEGFHDASIKLLEIANDENWQISVLEEITRDLRKIVYES